MLRLILFSIVLIFVSEYEAKERPEDLRKVHLEGLGNVLGNKFWDGEFYEFFGIPYATVPKGQDRYKPPLPPKPWDEDLKANRGILLCQQVYESNEEGEGDMLYGEEDCLVVSLMVPKKATATNLVPVIVYVHSGAFVGGSGNMAKFHFLARQDVIVVNMNYRLGALGFACLGTEEIPGNAALKDIVAALKFIKKHVKSFGGDPDNITLAGYGIGATLAELVALSPATRGLFDKLALDSGSALTPFAVNRHPIETARNMAVSVGYDDTGRIEDLNDFYLDGDTEDIQGVSRNFFLKNSTFGFAPCIENPNNPEAVLIESPLETLKKGDYGDFALLTGWANMEGISRTSQFDDWHGQMNENLADFLPADLVFDNEKERDDFIREVKQYYFDGKPLTIDSLQGFIDYFSDSMFRYAIVKSLKLHAENLKRSIYAYEFTYVGKLNTQHNYMDRIRGASHRDASAYILDFHSWTRNFTDMDMRDLMNYMWGDFLRFENPTKYESPLLTMKWLKYDTKNTYYLDMGYELVMKQDPFSKGYQLWDKVYKKHYWNPTVVSPEAYEKAQGSKINTKAKRVDRKPVETKPQETKSDDTPAAAIVAEEKKPSQVPTESKLKMTEEIPNVKTKLQDTKSTNTPAAAKTSEVKLDNQKTPQTKAGENNRAPLDTTEVKDNKPKNTEGNTLKKGEDKPSVTVKNPVNTEAKASSKNK